MSLSPLLEYQRLALPSLDVKSWKNISLLEEKTKKEVEKYLGEPVAIPYADLPNVYHFLLFKHLYPAVPEIIFEVQTNFSLVLHTIYSPDEYTRPESVHLFSDVIHPSSSLLKIRVPTLTLDLSSLPNTEIADIQSTITRGKHERKEVTTLLLTGNTDPLTALLTYILWRPYAKSVRYRLGAQEIAL